MTYNPYFKSTADDSFGAKFAVFIVKFNNQTIPYTSNFGTSTAVPTFTSTRATVSSIETLRNPFNESLTTGSDGKIMTPPGKYWLDGRLGMRNGTSTYNYQIGFSFGIGGYIDSLSEERWLRKQGVAYLEETVNRYIRKNVQCYYEATSSNSYVRVYHRRAYSSWPAGSNPELNRNGSSDFSTSTSYPYGATRLLIMRLE